MLIFILSFAFTIIVSYCFFKSKFWENRYLVLLIGSSVALVATLVVNYSVRGKLPTKTEITFEKSLQTFYIPDTLAKDTTKTPYLKNYNYYVNHKAKEYNKDTTKKQRPVTIIFYSYDKKKQSIYIGTRKFNGNQNYYELKNVYIARSTADSIAIEAKKRLDYDVKLNKWITGFSFPFISEITVLYIPPKEYDLIPDSLIRKLPF